MTILAPFDLPDECIVKARNSETIRVQKKQKLKKLKQKKHEQTKTKTLLQ